jgi:hypothetical protein
MNPQMLLGHARRLIDAAAWIDDFRRIPGPAFEAYQECIPMVLADVLEAISAILSEVGISESWRDPSVELPEMGDEPLTYDEALDQLTAFLNRARVLIDIYMSTSEGNVTALAGRMETFGLLLKDKD